MAGRAYGLGPYGTGRYGVGAAAVYDVAGAASIAFAVKSVPNASYGVAAATSIQLAVSAKAALTSATQIAFRVQCSGPLRVITAGATGIVISFSVQGMLVRTWVDDPAVAPCQPGTWTQDMPPWTIRQAA
jgi:hypothetical protein